MNPSSVKQPDSLYQTPAQADAGCKDPVRSRIYEFGPQILFVSAQSKVGGGATADILVQLSFPCRVIQICSVLVAADSVFFHLAQLSKQYAGNAIVPTGFENWIPMTSQPISAGAPFYWTTIRLREAVKQFYLDMGTEAVGQNTINLMCVADPDALIVSGGPWT